MPFPTVARAICPPPPAVGTARSRPSFPTVARAICPPPPAVGTALSRPPFPIVARAICPPPPAIGTARSRPLFPIVARAICPLSPAVGADAHIGPLPPCSSSAQCAPREHIARLHASAGNHRNRAKWKQAENPWELRTDYSAGKPEKRPGQQASRARNCERKLIIVGLLVQSARLKSGIIVQFCCPAPHRAGGLKFGNGVIKVGLVNRPAPHRAGGLKCREWGRCCNRNGPAPHRAGGLKYRRRPHTPVGIPSRPPQGGWIEIAVYKKHIRLV